MAGKEARQILRGLSGIFGVPENDLPRTVQRFVDDVNRMEDLIKKVR